MAHSIDQPLLPDIHQWKETGDLLEKAMSRYIELSISLKDSLWPKKATPKELTTQIGYALEQIQDSFFPKIFRIRSTLAQIRNSITCPTCALPREVLSEIFANVVFDFSYYSPVSESLKTKVFRIYRAIYNLIGVCTEWRDVVLNNGSFWSIIPIFGSPSYDLLGENPNPVPTHMLERSKGNLYLVATQLCNPISEPVLSELVPRFRAVNISTKSLSTVRNILSAFLVTNLSAHLGLSEISIYKDQRDSYYESLPQENNNVFSPGSTEHNSFTHLISSLSAIRIRGTQLCWHTFNYSHRLTELHLQEVLFGYDEAVANFLGTLSSASQLRVLKFISLPSLQILLADDLYFNTLDTFLSSITSRSHHLRLLLSGRSLYLRFCRGTREREEIGWETLCELMRNVLVKDLLITGDGIDPWPSSSPKSLGELIKSVVPGLETLWMNSWNFDAAYCNVLTHSSLSQGSLVASIANLYITRAKVFSSEAIVDMVTSHLKSIRQLELGLAVQGDAEERWTPVEGDHPLANAFKDIIPDCRITNYQAYPVEFEDAPWELW
ncbi:unnamed protein product [Rhizoctonia solani]|uniref:F-box domain-containing protein n=1 Tax=Rhizoctonia solani TaxID=456999 RepID=A0A8H3CA68_9AGAM|nr:unnamed protein product [Rhizoctonia solani]